MPTNTYKGRFRRYCAGHAPRRPANGFCQCGCGQRTRLHTRTNKALGEIKGQPRRFCIGHQPKQTPVESFWAHIDKGPHAKGCWLWKSRNRGYAQLRVDGETVSAHRFSYELHFGPIPEGLCVLHRCDVRQCVRPDHLFLGTKGDNNRDASRKGRAAAGVRHGSRLHPDKIVRGERVGGAKLNADMVRAIRRAHADGSSMGKLAREYAISVQSIFGIVRRLTWKHID